MTTIILSDLHLGTKACNARALLDFLQAHTQDLIILNGDIIDGVNFSRMKHMHWSILKLLRSLPSAPILIRGNHDVDRQKGGDGETWVLSSLLGVSVKDKHDLLVGNHRYLVTHGDRFDPTIRWPILTDAADWCYRTTQHVSRKAARKLKQWSKEVGGIVHLVKQGAIQEAKRGGYNGVITGHTHFPDDEMIDGIHYLNCGSWTDPHPTHVQVDNASAKLVCLDS